jgi:UDP-N-acetylglucosamine acyltransferase
MHKVLYREDLTLQVACERIAQLDQNCPECAPDVEMMFSFLKQASPQRGIVR